MSVVIVGAGPAGSAAAILLARAGVPTCLVEGRKGPSKRPGESLHPGVEAIFERLGVRGPIESSDFRRHLGHWVSSGQASRFQAFGGPKNNPWRGFQAPAAKLDRLLLDQALAEGAHLVPTWARHPLLDGTRVIGIKTSDGETIPASWLIDASGGGHWLSGQLRLKRQIMSPRLYATYGYRSLDGDAGDNQPKLCCCREGWRWEAPLGDGRVAWVNLDLSGNGEADALSQGVRANVTWRRQIDLAGPGFLIAGDAAGVLDPASSHGVLRALMSGMMAAQTVLALIQKSEDSNELCLEYTGWLAGWFDHDASSLTRFYAAPPFHCHWAGGFVKETPLEHGSPSRSVS